MVFDLENPVSLRLNNLLYKHIKNKSGRIRIVDRRSNANLIIYTYTLIAMLDYLINKNRSYFYHFPQPSLFRSLGNDGITPQYSIPVLDPKKYFKAQVLSDEDHKKTDERKNSKHTDRSTEFQTENTLEKSIAREIEHANLTNSVFSIVIFHLFTLSATESKQIFIPVISALAGVIKVIIRHLLDTPFRLNNDDLLIILKKTSFLDAIGIARRIFLQVKKRNEFSGSNYRLSIGIIQSKSNWKIETYWKLINKIKLILKGQKLSRIVYFDNKTNSIKAHKLG